ncbi:hypothetical protein F7725_007389 [Dissostichus mawsoni]|uniref:Uncharacterized protein n=1 Tax=Dissostichus mawsoni TaxID=36200 RepID=A0A7J5XYC1_DISMA|nr:hypothetical protein F7725_007389 [Dissostichus mawsoni]
MWMHHLHILQGGAARKLRLSKRMDKFGTKANTWVQAQKKNNTSSHLRDQAALVLEKCQALGARGVLFLARPGIRKEWTCEVMMPRCNVSSDASTCLRRMEVLFEFVAKGWSHTEPAAASETPQPPAENSPATSKVVIATADAPTESSGNPSEEMYTLTLIPVPAASTYSPPSPSAASQPGKRKKGLPTERSSSPRLATSVANGCSSTTGEGMKKRNKGMLQKMLKAADIQLQRNKRQKGREGKMSKLTEHEAAMHLPVVADMANTCFCLSVCVCPCVGKKGGNGLLAALRIMEGARVGERGAVPQRPFLKEGVGWGREALCPRSFPQGGGRVGERGAVPQRPSSRVFLTVITDVTVLVMVLHGVIRP